LEDNALVIGTDEGEKSGKSQHGKCD
jgi:hypothetical protein